MRTTPAKTAWELLLIGGGAGLGDTAFDARWSGERGVRWRDAGGEVVLVEGVAGGGLGRLGRLRGDGRGGRQARAESQCHGGRCASPG
ncbi:hypothetical protein [Streptomyces cellostaticus]|uniref:hypothetical protein n=1 Tax=Streptomyces cellostaticus TaxID=67285 RepID=UPI00131C930E|nr:hypothetical protein [Streptomyces cellostaticus]